MKRIAIYLDWPDRLDFFRRVHPALEPGGYSPVYWTNKLALFQRARALGWATRLLRRVPTASSPSLEHCREVVAGALTPSEAVRLHASAISCLSQLQAESPLAGLLEWNGGGVIGQAVRDHAGRFGTPTLFLEIANLPGKMIADPVGVNAQSALADDPSMLEGHEVSLDAFRLWRDGYVRKKLEHHAVPQAKVLQRVSYRTTALNWLGFRVLGVPTDDHGPLSAKLLAKLRRSRGLAPVKVDTAGQPFVLYPMQVSNDSQVLLNSDVDNESAIRHAAEVAQRRGCGLLVKPHPAEPDAAFIERIAALQSELGFLLVRGNTFQLIRQARHVVTINSTVGLEALLLGRSVEFLGRTYFRHLVDERRLAQYVMGYLVDIDYFSERQVPQAQVKALIRRCAPPAKAAARQA